MKKSDIMESMVSVFGAYVREAGLAEGLVSDIARNPAAFLSSQNPVCAEAARVFQYCLEGMSATGKDVLNACKRIVKGARKGIQGYWRDEAGNNCVTDGYRLVRLNKPLDGMEQLESAALDAERAIGDTSKYDLAITLPDIKEVKAFIAVEREAGRKGTKNHPFYPMCLQYGDAQDGSERVLVNPQFLLDMMCIFPDCKELKRCNLRLSAMYFSGENGDGILLPVRPENG